MLGPPGNLPSYEQWERVRGVLAGDEENRISDRAAAKAAGVSLATVRSWVDRSRLRNPVDEPYVHEIAEVWDERHALQQGVLEDQLFHMAMNPTEEVEYGTTPDGKEVVLKRKAKGAGSLPAVNRLLEARGGIYAQKGNGGVNVNVNVIRDDDEAYERFKASRRMREVEKAKAQTIDSTPIRALEHEPDTLNIDVLPDGSVEMELAGADSLNLED